MRVRTLSGFTRKVSTNDRERVRAWWRTLTPLQRRTLARDPGRSRVVCARFVESSQDVDPPTVDLYEYLVNHEVFLVDGPKAHICTAERTARDALRRGRLPADFRCPRGSSACPMRRLLGHVPGRDVVFFCGGAR